MSRASEVQEGIIKLLKANPTIPMSWGLHSTCNYPTEEKHKEGIVFSVNGFLHKGYVAVLLDHAKDYYEVRIIDNNGSIEETITDIFFDDLVNIIDTHVECSSEGDYHKKVDGWFANGLSE